MAREGHIQAFHGRYLKHVAGKAAFNLQEKFFQLLDEAILLPTASPFPSACKSRFVLVLSPAEDKTHGLFSPCVIPQFSSSPCMAHPAQLCPSISPPATNSRAGRNPPFSQESTLTAPRKLALSKNSRLAGCKIHNLCSVALNPPSKSHSCCIFNHRDGKSSHGQRWDPNPCVSVWRMG